MSDNDLIDPSEVPDDERLEIVYIRLEDICTDYVNPNSMSDGEFTRLVESIRVLGFVQPCVVVRTEQTEVDTELPFVMGDGFHRWRGLAALDREVCPSIVARDWDHAETIIARIALNKNRGNPNITAVAQNMVELQKLDVDIDDLCTTGYTEPEISNMVEALQADLTNIDPADFGGTTVTDNETDQGAAPRPFLLELTFKTKAERNTVRKALKHAGNGDISTGALALAGATPQDD